MDLQSTDPLNSFPNSDAKLKSKEIHLHDMSILQGSEQIHLGLDAYAFSLAWLKEIPI